MHTPNLKGNGHTQDSFSLIVHEAARLLAVETDYETIHALSGNAFAPAINTGENCTAWWHVEGRMGDRAMRTVAAAIGLRAERLEIPSHGLTPEDSEEAFERKALRARQQSARVINEALQDSAVVLTSGGWRVRGDDGFAPWGWWGIVTKAADDGALSGACLGADPSRPTGYADRPLDYLGTTWALRAAQPGMSPADIDGITLIHAVARVRGTPPFASEGEAVYGLAAVDLWKRQMKTVPFCEACAHAGPKGMAGRAINNVQTTLAGARTAASVLRRMPASFPPDAQPHLEAASKHYNHVVGVLESITWRSYIDLLGDADRQTAHADEVIGTVAAELAAAARDMERALATTAPAQPAGGVR